MKTLLYGAVLVVAVIVLLNIANERGLVVEDLLPEAGAEEVQYQTDPDSGLSTLTLDGLESIRGYTLRHRRREMPHPSFPLPPGLPTGSTVAGSACLRP